MFEDLWLVLNSLLVFLFGFILIIKLGRTFEIGAVRALCIYLWHTVFCLVYFAYSLKFISDSNMYFSRALSGDVNFELGTAAVYTFTTFLVQGLGLSKLGCFLVFNIFGSVGLLAFDGSLKKAAENKSKYIKLLAKVIIFLPSVSFWSSAIGINHVNG
mgnify:CR=1 FL=1